MTFKNVSFSYPDSEKKVLRNVTFTIPGGSKVGIIGESGVGKSTLFQLLMRAAEPEEGRIMIDGQELNTMTLNLQDLTKPMFYSC